MAYRKSTVVVSAEDQASGVVQRISEDIIGHLEGLGRASSHISALAESFGLLNQRMGETQNNSRSAKDGIDSVSNSVLGLAGNVATSISGIKDMLELIAKLRSAGSAGPMGLAAVGLGAGVAGGLYEEAAKMDARTRELSQAPGSALGKEAARQAWQERIDREDAAEQARIKRNLARSGALSESRFAADDALRQISEGTGRIDPSSARRSMEGAISRSYDRGGLMSSDVRLEWITKADQAAQTRNKAADAAEREARATERTTDSLRGAMDAAINRSRTPAQRRNNDELDVMKAQMLGLLDPVDAAMAMADISKQYAPRQKQSPITQTPIYGGGNNLLESQFLTRGSGDSSDTDKLLREQLDVQKNSAEAIKMQVDALSRVEQALREQALATAGSL